MAAYIVRPSKQEWAIVEKFLDRCKEGAIVVTPAMQEWLDSQHVKVRAGALVDYDFGGEADILLDVMTTPEHSALWDLDFDLAERVSINGISEDWKILLDDNEASGSD